MGPDKPRTEVTRLGVAIFVALMLLAGPLSAEDDDEPRPSKAEEAAEAAKRAEQDAEQELRRAKAAEACRKIGGSYQGNSCICPDGIRITHPDAFRCWNKPFTPDELRKQCEPKLLSEPRVDAASLGLFAQTHKAKSASEVFAAMEKDPKWKFFFRVGFRCGEA